MTSITPGASGAGERATNGVNERARIKMTDEEVGLFLAERHNMTMCTLNPDGSIHAVAMWYGFLEGCIAVETKAKSQKAQNLRRNPAMTVLVEEGDTYEELRGVELVGTAEIVQEPERLMALGTSVYERYYGPYSKEAVAFVEAMLNKRIVAKLLVTKTVTWDHRKLDPSRSRLGRDVHNR
ncbi:MAG: pyridoxamine 5'-phosphate oxidase family protein [Acidimicrobiales bacterium]